MYSYQQQKKQINYNHQLIDELDKINYELHNDLCNEMREKVCFYHKIVCQDFVLYLKTNDIFALTMTLKNIEESVKYYEKVYKNYQFEEIPDYYLSYVEILSFFEKIVNEDEKFLRIKDYCFRIFKSRYNQYLCNGKGNFDNLFYDSIEYRSLIYEQNKTKNYSEVKRLLNNL